MSIKERIKIIKQQISPCALIAVSKTHPALAVKEAHEAGQIDFGENRVQELLDKQAQLPNDIHWHLIGSLQTNKVKFIAPFVYMIHSVDSIKLLEKINMEAAKNNRKINCLMQIYIASEETKHGFDKEEILDFFNTEQFKNFEHITFCGLMGMATNTDDTTQVANEFKNLNHLFNTIKNNHHLPNFKELSMWMSSDYEIAIEQGATMVRIGSSIFGSRS
ncbi:MAG: YggS family pyridoxal phosphate-dependent enzyme [Bacteroidetes bacterium]|nr:YggS family pyridoxal phosphate-dependent enzyme [Bacteroidota bacterium]